MIKCICQGRLGNRMLQTAGIYILAKKFNLTVHSSLNDYFNWYPNFIQLLNPTLYSGTINHNTLTQFTDEDLISLLEDRIIINTGIIFQGYFQVKDFVIKYREEIKNTFKPIYFNIPKDSVFVHIIASDAASFTPSFEYYNNILTRLSFNSGYIATDDPNHGVVKQLIERYKLQIYNKDPVTTIVYGASFKNIILSGGTFSWWIGLLSNNSNVFYPENRKYICWHGDIFVYSDWYKGNCE